MFTGLATVLYVACYAYLVRFGRLGLIKPKLFWKPFKPDARRNVLAISAAGLAVTSLSHRANPTSDGIDSIVLKEMLKIKELGFGRKSWSDDELRSERKLYRFMDRGKQDRTTPPIQELRGVRRKDVFLHMRKIVDDWYAARAAKDTAYQEWLVEVGEMDQTHLLKDGWIAFLESLSGSDIHLWHGIATDFHDLFGDRLDAAFWIVQQDACDRATASDFIAGYLYYFLSAEYVDITKRDARLNDFLSVIRAYNAGKYTAHSIKAGTHTDCALDDATAAEILIKYEAAQGLTNLPRPKGLINSTIPPSDSNTRGYASPYAFWDDAGLHLEYPGPDWRNAS
ncbi:MAG: hypothetical protein ABJJ99_20180 [Ascidiaceihabitans sp.]|uniref:hypothetical protein n=2 Tax=Ascidiaceihabitans sp. TaxID=1872644 RepID=UPI00329A6C80